MEAEHGCVSTRLRGVTCCAVLQVVILQSITPEAWFQSHASLYGIHVVGEVALVRVFWLSPVIIIVSMLRARILFVSLTPYSLSSRHFLGVLLQKAVYSLLYDSQISNLEYVCSIRCSVAHYLLSCLRNLQKSEISKDSCAGVNGSLLQIYSMSVTSDMQLWGRILVQKRIWCTSWCQRKSFLALSFYIYVWISLQKFEYIEGWGEYKQSMHNFYCSDCGDIATCFGYVK